jgi:hypothetical protein
MNCKKNIKEIFFNFQPLVTFFENFFYLHFVLKFYIIGPKQIRQKVFI